MAIESKKRNNTRSNLWIIYLEKGWWKYRFGKYPSMAAQVTTVEGEFSKSKILTKRGPKLKIWISIGARTKVKY